MGVGRLLLLFGIAAALAACSLIPAGCPAALLSGTLVADGQGGLAVQAESGVTPVRWPGGYRVAGDDELVLRDGWGSVIAAAGDTIYVGGGMNTADDLFIACGYVSRDPP